MKKSKNKKSNNHNFLLKVMSILFAMIAWFIVIKVENPEDTLILKNIPIEVINQDAVEKDGLMYYGLYDEEVSVKFSGGKINLGKLREYSSSIIANCDIGNYYTQKSYKTEEGTYLPISIVLPEKIRNLVKIESQSLEYVKVKLDKKVILNKDLETDIKINVGKEYFVDEENIKVLPKSVEIIGPKVLIDKISSVKATGEIINDGTKINEAQVKVYDVDGKIIDGVKIMPEKVQLQAMVLKKKTLKFSLDVKDLLAQNRELESVKFNPSEITLAGTKEEIEKLSDDFKIEIDLEKNNGEYTKNKNIKVPNNLVNVNDVNSIVVTYKIKNSK